MRNVPDRSRAKQAYRQLPSLFATDGWSVADVKSAVREHELGQFYRSALLSDAFGRNDRIVSALDTIILGILRLPFKLKPSATMRSRRRAELVRDALQKHWGAAVTEDQLYQVLFWVIWAGFCLVEVVWNTDDPAFWYPERLQVWHPQFIYWREDKRVFVLQTADGPIEVDPDDLGAKFILIAPGGYRSWMRGAVRSVADDFVSYDETMRAWRRHSEVHGGGIIKAKVPSGLGDSKDKDRYVESLANLGAEPVIECPQDETGKGYDAELLETGRDHAAGFKMLLEQLTANINVRILGQNASTENAGPYVAKGGLFAKVTLDRIDGLVGPLEQALLRDLATPFALFNFGEADAAPVPDWDSEPPQDKQAQAQTMLVTAQAIAALKSAGIDIDPAEISERFGFSLRAALADEPTIPADPAVKVAA